MRLPLRIGVLSLIVLVMVVSQAQVLPADSIAAIQKIVSELPDEMVYPSELVVIETNLGDIRIRLDFNYAPMHAMNFKKLVKAGFYDGTLFHRVIPDFVIQGGDILSRDGNPGNDGTGDPGYTLMPEFGLKHRRGALAAARRSDEINPRRESNGSQFYICLQDLPMLDRMGYSVFGHVVTGMAVVDQIARRKTDKRDRPLENIVMRRVYIAQQEAPKDTEP